MAPAKKRNITIDLPEECGKVPKLTSLNQNVYVLWDEVDEDLQALINKNMETVSASMTVGNVVFVLCGQADEKANGNPTQNGYIMFCVGMVCDHKNPAPGKEFNIRFRDGEVACDKGSVARSQQKNNTKQRKRRTASKNKAKNRYFRPQKPPKKFYAAVWRGRKI